MGTLNLLALGFNSDLSDKIISKSLNLSALRGMNQRALVKIGFSEAEAIFIRDKVNRKPIPLATVKSLLSACGGVCCYCDDGNNTRPYQIHHMDEYSNSQDHQQDNLLVVCPNHHVQIHSSKITVDDQLAKKRSWENLWSIASAYQQRGIAFPFGAFEFVDYNSPGLVTEIFSLSPPRPSICGILTRGSTQDDGVATLADQHKLVLSGGSGSGKTTLSLGIAARFTGYSVYRFVLNGKSSIEIANEILQFLSLVSTNVILIIDDANTKIFNEQIEKVLSAAEDGKKIILINTRSTLSSAGNFEQRVLKSVIPISWGSIQNNVKTNLLQYESEIIKYLKDYGLDHFHNDKIGFSQMDRSLKEVMDIYSLGTESVWEFIFMLSSGTQLLDRQHIQLRKDNLDLIVAFIGTGQIAGVEHGSSISEIKKFFSEHAKLKSTPLPTDEWLLEKMEDLIRFRVISRSRDRYKVVHRLYALRFLELCHFKTRKDIEEILDAYFKHDLQEIRKVMILWSWLSSSTVNQYIRTWTASLTMEEWKNIGWLAINDELQTFKILCDQLHPGANIILPQILCDKATILAAYLNNPQEHAIYYFSRISMAIRYHCPEIWKPLLSEIDQDNFALLIKNSKSWYFMELGSFFYALSENGQNAWIVKLATLFDQKDFLKIAEDTPRGDIRSLSDVMYFHRRYIADLRISQFKEYMNVFAHLMKDCDISDMQFPVLNGSFTELMLYPEMVDAIAGSIDVDKLAKQFVTLSPKHWENLLSLSFIVQYGTLNIIEDMLDRIDLDVLMETIKAFYLDNLHEFRVIIYQLAYAKENRRKEFAPLLYSFVERSVIVDSETKNLKGGDILVAFSNLDDDWVERFCQLHQVSLEKDIHDSEEQGIDYAEVLERIQVAEKTGEDYVLRSFKIE